MPKLAALVQKHFGQAGSASSPAKWQQITRLKKILTEEKENRSTGRKHFAQRCAACHQSFDDGGEIAPDPTGYERDNLESMKSVFHLIKFRLLSRQ